MYVFVVPALSCLSDEQAIAQPLGQMWEGSNSPTLLPLCGHEALQYPPWQQGLIVQHFSHDDDKAHHRKKTIAENSQTQITEILEFDKLEDEYA